MFSMKLEERLYTRKEELKKKKKRLQRNKISFFGFCAVVPSLVGLRSFKSKQCALVSLTICMVNTKGQMELLNLLCGNFIKHNKVQLVDTKLK